MTLRKFSIALSSNTPQQKMLNKTYSQNFLLEINVAHKLKKEVMVLLILAQPFFNLILKLIIEIIV